MFSENIKNIKMPWFLEEPNPAIYHTATEYIVCDTETTNNDFGSAIRADNRLVLAAWLRIHRDKDGECVRRAVRGGEYEQGEVVQALERTQFCIGHNIKFDLQWFRRCGLDLHKVLVYDTQIAEKVILGNRQARLDLDSVAMRHGVGRKHRLGASLVHSGEVPTEDVPESILQEYCLQDIEVTHEVFKAQLRVFVKFPWLLPVVYTRCLLTPVLADIEFNGLKLDSNAVKLEFDGLTKQTAALGQQLHEITGGINLNSHKQVGEYLYGTLSFKELSDFRGEPRRTPAGKPLTDSQTIAALRPSTKQQRDFLEAYKSYNEANQALSKSIAKFQAACERGDNLYAQFNQTVTQTHRLSSTGRAPYNVQFQNLFREYKKLFRAKKDNWLMGEGDGANLEFRVAGFLGQDANIYKDIVNQVDVHAFTSSILTNAGQETNRQDAKTHTFKPLYGGQSGTKAEREYYKAFRDKYWQCYEEQQGWVEEVLRSRERALRTPWGLTFYWPDTKVTRSGYIENTSSIFNYPVQSLATAEIIPIGVVFFWHLLAVHKAKMEIVNTVHDSIVCELPPEECDLFKELLLDALTNRVYKYLDQVYKIKFNFPLGCGIKVGSHWGTGSEQKINAVMPPWKFEEAVENES